MALERNPITFNRLKALSMRHRGDIARDPDMAVGLLSSLTPTDLALLFPTYFKKILPDVGGFRAAISKQSSAQQAAAQGQLLERLSAVEKTASSASIMRPWSQRVSAAIARPPAQLNAEQMGAWSKLQQGPLSAASSEGKIFGKLSDSQLASIGVTRTKDNTGADIFRYEAPTVGREEAISRLQAGEKGNFAQRASAFMSRLQNDLGVTKAQAAGMLGSLGAETGGLRAINEANPVVPGSRGGFGWAQWTGPRRREFESFAASKGLDIRSDEANYQFFVHELRTTEAKALSQVKKTDSVEDAARAFTGSAATGTGYLRPGVEHYGSSVRFAQQAYAGAPAPAGSKGQYSEDQINKMIEQLKVEKSETRKQQLANLIVNIETQQGLPRSPDATAIVTNKMQYTNVPDFSKFAIAGGVDNYTHMCGKGARVLAGHMYGHSNFINEGLGADGTAGSLSRGNNYFQKSGLFRAGQNLSPDQVSNQSYLESLPIGTVISSTGGRRGQGHAQIKIGPNKWASDTVQSHFLSKGYENFVVHVPNDQGLAQLEKNGVTQSSVEIPSTQPKQMAGEPPEALPPAPPAAPASYDPEIPYAPDTGGPAPTATVDKTTKQEFQQPQEALNPQAVKDIKAQETAAPAPPKPATPNRYKLDTSQLVSAIRQTEEFKSQAGIFAGAVPDSTILDGFFADSRVKAAGVTYDPSTGELRLKNPDDPQVKKVMEGFDTKRFMKPIEEPKPKVQEPPKPAPTATVEKRTSRPGEAPEATPPAPPEPAPKAVQGFSDGGSFNAPDNINFYKVDKNDDIVAINPQTQQPVATMQSGEGLSMGDSRVDVTPQSKANDTNPVPTPDTNTQLTNIMSNISESLSDIGKTAQQAYKSSPMPQSNHSNLIADTNRQIANQQKFSPSYDRAMHRISRGTEPTGSFDHFSYGNK